ncbi:hypothetical protein MPSEU_000913200 [Mayamaea pseudoterrestris]|nr:hypothetical protein MPSEU_000913200 [Mayamaea pseudoterrestris]
MGPLVPIIVGLLAVLFFFVGIFDRPSFEYHDSILTASQGDLIAIVATSKDPRIANKITSALGAAEAAILTSPDGARFMKEAAQYYGQQGEKVAVGMYFDDPTETSNPHWSAGWLIQADFKQARLIAAQGSAAGVGATIKAIRIPNSQVLKASIPWRSFITPMIAPMLHWSRGFAQYEKDQGKVATLALEIYSLDENGKYKAVDYIVYPDRSVPMSYAFGAENADERDKDTPEETPNVNEEHIQEQRIEEEVQGDIPVEEVAYDGTHEHEAQAETDMRDHQHEETFDESQHDQIEHGDVEEHEYGHEQEQHFDEHAHEGAHEHEHEDEDEHEHEHEHEHEQEHYGEHETEYHEKPEEFYEEEEGHHEDHEDQHEHYVEE